MITRIESSIADNISIGCKKMQLCLSLNNGRIKIVLNPKNVFLLLYSFFNLISLVFFN